MKKQTTFAVLAAAAFALCGATGCIVTEARPMPGTIIPYNTPVEQGKYTVLNGGRVVTGSVTIDYLKANEQLRESAMKKAVDQALAQCPGADALIGITTDSQTYSKTLWTPLIPWPLEFTYTTFVTGTPVKKNP